MMDWISIAGAIASFFGAGVSWCQSANAKKSAELVLEAKKSIQAKNMSLTLEKLKGATSELCGKLCRLRGGSVDKGRVNKMIGEFMPILSDAIGHLSSPDKETFEHLRSNIQNCLGRIMNDTDVENNLSKIDDTLNKIITEVSKIVNKETFA